MSSFSKIEWTDSTWNPVTGCTKISDGCANCYAFRMAKRLKAMGNCRYTNGFKVTIHEDLVELPLKWKNPRLVFVNSMSDLFHEEVPDDFILKIFETMNRTPHHNYQILTKRSQRLAEIAHRLNWTPNIWQGVSVENEAVIHRIYSLKKVPAHVRFISFEPLIGRIAMADLADIHWVIVGGESGPKARPMKAQWVEEIRDLCLEQEIPFFFKQWGGVQKHLTGRILNGRTWDQYPEVQEVI